MSIPKPELNEKPETDSLRSKQLRARRAHYKTPEFRDAITDAFHQAKIDALDNQIVAKNEAKE